MRRLAAAYRGHGLRFWSEWLAWTLAALCVAVGPVWPYGTEPPIDGPPADRRPACQCLLVVEAEPVRSVRI